METISYAWLWIGGGLAGIVGALALGVSPTLLLVGASVLACPLAMYFGMRAMGGPQDTTSAPCHNRAAVLEPPHTPAAVDATVKR